MSQQASPFDHRADEELGSALRDALGAGNDRQFTRRVLDAAEPVFGEVAAHWWAALAAWARPSVVAAMLLVAAAGFWFGLRVGAASANGETTAAVTDPLLADAGQILTIPVLLAGYEPPNMGDVLGAALNLTPRDAAPGDPEQR